MPTYSGWWELSIDCAPALEDLIFWRLDQLGCRGTACETLGSQLRVRAYFHTEQVNPAEITTLEPFFHSDAQDLGCPDPTLSWQGIQEEDWAQAWKQYWHPQEIGDRLLINPAWLPTPTDSSRLVLRLDPGVAFGTGAHPTTQLCLEGLEQYLGAKPPGQVVADVGCGSGILSIASVLFGATQVYSVDPDPLAVQSTQDNWALNGLSQEKLWVAEGSAEQILAFPDLVLDGIVCNILAPVIINLMPELTAMVSNHSSSNSPTWMLLSGLLVSQVPAVIESAHQHGWELIDEWHRQDWACLGWAKSGNDSRNS